MIKTIKDRAQEYVAKKLANRDMTSSERQAIVEELVDFMQYMLSESPLWERMNEDEGRIVADLLDDCGDENRRAKYEYWEGVYSALADYNLFEETPELFDQSSDLRKRNRSSGMWKN